MNAWKGLFHVLVVGSAVVLWASAVAWPVRAEEPPPDVTADALSAAARMSSPLQLSPVVSPTDYNNYLPAAAYNSKHHEFLIVWQRRRADSCMEIWARRLSASGQLLTHFNIYSDPCPKDHVLPAVAYNASEDNYLVVWMYYPGGITTPITENKILGRTVAWNGASMGGVQEIIKWPNRCFWRPRVAWNSRRNEYMVVWTAFDTATGQPADVAHAILYASGLRRLTKIITWDKAPQEIDVTYHAAADEYFAVWRRMWTPSDGDIMGARLDALYGDVITPPGVIEISAEIYDQMVPRITTNQTYRYLVAWSQLDTSTPSSSWDIYAQELQVNGTRVGSAFDIMRGPDDETAPAAAALPGWTRNYMVTWQWFTGGRYAIKAWRGGDLGSEWVLDVANTPSWNNVNPALVVGGPAFLIAYESRSLVNPAAKSHIFARLYWPHVTYLPMIRR